MTFVIILIILVLVWTLFGDKISAWFRARMIGQVEDTIRRSMGMPSRKEERRRQKQAEKEARRNGGFTSNERYRQSSSNPYQYTPDSIIPKEYAEDVEFVEYKDYSSNVEVKTSEEDTSVKVEEQVTDVEFTEIKS